MVKLLDSSRELKGEKAGGCFCGRCVRESDDDWNILGKIESREKLVHQMGSCLDIEGKSRDHIWIGCS